ncbi:MAG: response regulator transcription factor [Actinobacteria bacterium]|nr:response regulator transcription factor [Actinomycetota bacterium]
MSPVRVAIVDDHRVFREGLAALLEGRDGITVTADFDDAEALYSRLDALDVDVLLLDLHLPGESGLQAAARLARERPELRILVLTMHDDVATVRAAIDAGASGYLVKTSGLDDIARAVISVSVGQFVLGAGTDRARAPLPRRDPREAYTDRERQVLDLLAEGATTMQIADRLGISGKTVRNYLSTLYAKLGVEDRGQAALAARRLRDAAR